jgi:hypothetical protein
VIAANADRNFLVARLYAEAFASGPEPVDLQGTSWQDQAATLSAAFEASLDRMAADREWLNGLLVPLAFARGQGRARASGLRSRPF